MMARAQAVPPFLRAFWGIAGLVAAVSLALTLRAESPLGAAGGILIVAAVAVPIGFWCARVVPGIPIFPIYAATYLWTFGLPLLLRHPVLENFDTASQFSAALAVVGFLLLGTLAWAGVARLPAKPAARWSPPETRSRSALVLLVAALLNVVLHGTVSSGVVTVSGGVFALLRGLLLGTASVAAFVLPYLWGRGELSPRLKRGTVAALALNLAINMSGLLLVGALSLCVLIATGHILGSRRVRAGFWLVLGAGFVFLHYGKGTMRERYWNAPGAHAPRPAEYPAFFAAWVRASYDQVVNGDAAAVQPFGERASLVQLFLRARAAQANGLPHLHGTTYAVIPALLVPRVIAPDKPQSHEGTFLLNIHYGLQTRDDTRRATIGWGLFNEAYANFDLAGLAALALLLGAGAGILARWTIGADPLSGRFLLAVLALSTAFQTEFSAGVFVTSLAQSSVGLLAYLAVRRAVVPRRRRIGVAVGPMRPAGPFRAERASRA